ncbi:MAG: capsule assembly Wzi family protein [bacterium]|nr:capsule assembly Wzi family protein [bacterium]
MKIKLLTLLFLLMICFTYQQSSAQVENVPLSNSVYDFLKEMRVKGIITNYNDDDPGMARFQVADRLQIMNKKKSRLGKVETELLEKYMIEFLPEEINKMNTTSLFGGNMKMSHGIKELFTDKQKYLYAYQKVNNNIFINTIGQLFYINQSKPDSKPNAKLFYGGFSIRGSLFEKLGYYLSVEKGGGIGDTSLMEAAFPRIRSNFKYVENIENIKNFDFTNGYMKFYSNPTEDMDLFVQIGREQLKYGLGYSKRLVLSGDAPNMDFIKFNLNYGIVSYSSIFGSTVGEFNKDVSKNFTKYFIANRIKLSFKKLFDIGVGESIITSRGFELGYLNPVIFYKFVEHSLQDRDNGTLFADFQTHFIKNFELQGTFFLDENILSNLADMTKQSNKTAYQLGFFYHEPVGIKNLSLIFEYSKLRPYVYTHFNPKNTYTAFGEILGNPIGPNADQLFLKLNYNLSDRIKFGLEYEHTRKGENIYGLNGELIRNVGGNVYDSYRQGTDADKAYFLDGIRINTDNVKFNISYEPLKSFIFDLNFVYAKNKNLTTGINSDRSYGFIRFTVY